MLKDLEVFPYDRIHVRNIFMGPHIDSVLLLNTLVPSLNYKVICSNLPVILANFGEV